ncbi:FIG00605929: hypothetical protein [hydrothermal vent metagenome]|uniref:Deoxyhypusine synthase n=1 Tax=hydrothermal vent metagenome TaxID=652676 RepID=A0A3B1BYH0_9ZZZZ
MNKALFDREKLSLRPLALRQSDFSVESIKSVATKPGKFPELGEVAERIIKARRLGAPVILIIGAHVLRCGVQPVLFEMMERGFVTLVAGSGALMIHDFELGLTGKTTENVSRYIQEGQFGLWTETGWINDFVAKGWERGEGLGETIGKAISDGEYPYMDISLFARAYKLGIPVTVHVGIGYDIVHQHPNCNGAAYGATSYADFLRFAAEVERLEDGVVMNFGSAVMGPEVFLKALAMARNVAKQKGKNISRFTTLVCDLQNLKNDYRTEPSKNDPNYYFRPLKTMLVRSVANGGDSYFVRGNHADTLPGLWAEILQRVGEK